MATRTMKSIAHNISNQTGYSYPEAKTIVSELITDLNIPRISYNKNMRSWEISLAHATALTQLVVEG